MLLLLPAVERVPRCPTHTSCLLQPLTGWHPVCATACVLQNLKDPALVERLLARTPLKRLAQPEDVSGR